MKLYEVPPKTWVKVDVDDVAYGTFFFDHLDGAYSVCQGESGNIVHLAGWTEVTVVADNSLD